MRHVLRSLTILAAFGIGLVSLPALAGVPKIVMAEHFGTTW